MSLVVNLSTNSRHPTSTSKGLLRRGWSPVTYSERVSVSEPVSSPPLQVDAASLELFHSSRGCCCCCWWWWWWWCVSLLRSSGDTADVMLPFSSLWAYVQRTSAIEIHNFIMKNDSGIFEKYTNIAVDDLALESEATTALRSRHRRRWWEGNGKGVFTQTTKDLAEHCAFWALKNSPGDEIFAIFDDL